MRAQHPVSVSVPIPGNVPPTVIVAAIRSITPLIRHLGLMSRFEQVPAQASSFAGDGYFAPPYDDTFCYRITQQVALAPGLSKEVTYPTNLQRVGDTVRCRADAPVGIRVWSEFSVRLRPAAPTSPASASTEGTMDVEEWELHEGGLIESNSLLMPFISQVMADSHRELCVKIVDEAVKNYFNGTR